MAFHGWEESWPPEGEEELWPDDVKVARKNAVLASILDEPDIDKMVADSSERRGKKDLRHLFSFLARMAKLCPQEPMRKRCADHLSDLKDFVDSQSENIESSSLVPTRFETRPMIVDWSQEIWERIFRNNAGRVTGLHLCLSTHIPFLQNYFDTMEVLMKGPGHLEKTWRNYIAIMAASRHHCEYLVRHQEEMFLHNQGDADWLKEGLKGDSVPPMLKALDELNAFMAHRPWELESRHFKKLADEGWNVGQMVHAVVILATFHGLSSFVFSLGLRLEQDLSFDGSDYIISEPDLEREIPTIFKSGQLNWQEHLKCSTKPSGHSASGTSLSSMEPAEGQEICHPKDGSSVLGYPKTRADATNGTNQNGASNGRNEESSASGSPKDQKEAIGEHNMPNFETKTCGMFKQNKVDNVSDGEKKKDQLSSAMTAAPTMKTPAAARFRSAEFNDMTYQDFDKTGSSKLISKHLVEWEDARDTLNSLLHEGQIGDKVDTEWIEAREYTNNQVGNVVYEDHATDNIRRTILVYIDRLFGIEHDDFEYRALNQYLTLVHKVFLKKSSCFPERLTINDYERIRRNENMEFFDVVHYNNIIFQGRRVVELVFAVDALKKYRNEKG